MITMLLLAACSAGRPADGAPAAGSDAADTADADTDTADTADSDSDTADSDTADSDTADTDTADTAGTDTADTADTSDWLELHGLIGDTFTYAGIADVSVTDVDRPSNVTRTDVEGRWSLRVPPEPYVTLRFTRDGYLPTTVWIAPEEAMDPVARYPARLGTPDALAALYAVLGETPEPGTGVLLVDALDPGLSCIGGAPVTLGTPHCGAWREVSDGEWVAEARSNDDRADLMFVNVTPGPVDLTVTAPDGTPCAVPTGLTVEADAVTQVSAYCTYVVVHED